MIGDLVLGPRLEAIIHLAQDAQTVADIGCDHGKVSVRLALSGARVYAVDISQDSLQKAKKLGEQQGADDMMEYYCSDGLDDVPMGIDCIIISGMGERLIADILDRNSECAVSAKSMILLPMDGTRILREHLASRGYDIVDEELVMDEGRLYTAIKVKYNEEYTLSIAEIILGPVVLQKRNEYFDELVQREINKRQSKLAGIRKAKCIDKAQEHDTIVELNALKNVRDK